VAYQTTTLAHCDAVWGGRQPSHLGRKGLLDKAGQESARRTAENLNNPPPVDVTLLFKKQGNKLLVDVICSRGKTETYEIYAGFLILDDMTPAYMLVDAAIDRCVSPALV
jgi:hypothetical protein